MIIQIYAIVSEENAEALAKLGVDHIGIVVSKNGNREKGIVSLSKARKLIEIIKEYGKIATVILDTVDTKEVSNFIDELHMDILHVCKLLSKEELKILKRLLSSKGVELMYAVPVKGQESLSEAEKAQKYADFIMLDSPFESEQMKGFIGATGKIHDWKISANIVRSVYKPVILGGGLSSDNVEKAIKTVRPAGVDAKTSLDLQGEHGKKDIEKVKNFVRRIRDFERRQASRNRG